VIIAYLYHFTYYTAILVTTEGINHAPKCMVVG